MAILVFFENKFYKPDNISAKIYDLSGKELQKLKKTDILEGSISPDMMYSEHWTKMVRMDWPNYPYIIDFSYDVKIRLIVFLAGLQTANGYSCCSF